MSMPRLPPCTWMTAGGHGYEDYRTLSTLEFLQLPAATLYLPDSIADFKVCVFDFESGSRLVFLSAGTVGKRALVNLEAGVIEMAMLMKPQLFFMSENANWPSGAATFNPKGRFLRRWDRVMLIGLAYTVTVTPFEVGFLGIHELKFSALLLANRIVGEWSSARERSECVVGPGTAIRTAVVVI